MLISDALIIPILHKNDHMQGMENENMEGAHVSINRIFCV
jgi:hypothetical protein